MKRIKRSRAKDARMPNGSIYVGRPTKWGNPYEVIEGLDAWLVKRGSRVISMHKTRELAIIQAVNCFRDYVDAMTTGEAQDFVEPLRGHDLACWCSLDQPCHADVLIEMMNEDL